jgi:ubiquitin carboxyl-terminal hydrolase 8
METTDVKLGVSKFNNIMGITCYMNSILHILQQTPIFVEYISQAKFRDALLDKIEEKIKKDNLEDTDETAEELINKYVIFELFKLFKISLENDDANITPTTFKKIIGTKNDMWNEYNHQDSQEFFTFLISQLEEEIGTKSSFVYGFKYDEKLLYSINDALHNIVATKSWEKFQYREHSPLKKMFDGMLETENTCRYCKCKSMNYQPFLTLSLSIPVEDKIDEFKPHSIYDCLDHMIIEEKLDADNKMNCEMCGLKTQGNTKTMLWKTPKILVLHIKRFLFNSYGIATQKLNNNIIYPFENLDLEKYFDPLSPHKNKSKYDLIGVNLHQSLGNHRNISAGHYTSFVKNMINNTWNLYNDSANVITLQHKEQLQNSNAYLLFYFCHD